MTPSDTAPAPSTATVALTDARRLRGSILSMDLQIIDLAPSAGHGATTKARILETAVVQFAQTGFEASTMRDLAREVGIKAPAIYNHYASKEEVLAAAIQQILGEFFRSVLGPLETMPVEDWLRQIVSGHVRTQLSKPEVYPASDSLLNGPTLERALPPEITGRIKTAQRMYVELLRALVLAAATDLSELDARMIAFSITATCDRVAAWWKPEGPLTVDEIGDRSWQLVERMLRPAR